MKKLLTLLCAVAVASSLIGCAPVTVPTFEYNCLGKNGTCPTKQTNPLDFFCAVCDPDHDNIEGIKKEKAPSQETPAPEAPTDVPDEPVEPDIPDQADDAKGSEDEKAPAAPSSPALDDEEEAADEPADEPEAETVYIPTVREENALRSAKSYLSSAVYSRSGLIQRLKNAGYTAGEAAYAAENCGGDWYKQAEKSAEKHLSRTPYTLNLLIKQLEIEGFTSDEAEQGATAVYNRPLSQYPSTPLKHTFTESDN